MKKVLLMVASIALIVTMTGCQSADLVGSASAKSFDAVLTAIPGQIAPDDAFGGFALTAPDGSARFIWSKDYVASKPLDATLEIPVQPFLDAGLDAAKLPEGMLVGDKLLIGADFGDAKPTYTGDATPLKAYQMIVDTNRKSVGYHKALDHYGIKLGGGNMFEWAKDIKTNDKDIVFVVNPQVFIDAGVNPENVAGWAYAQVTVEDDNGKKENVMKFLKPFDIQ